MRIIIAFIFTLCSIFNGFGRSTSDTLNVYFNLGKDVFEPALGDNGVQMQSFIDKVSSLARTDSIDNIYVYGYASPDGPLRLNRNLSKSRCETIARYISTHTGISRSKIKMIPEGVAWIELRRLVLENKNLPGYDSVLEILDGCTNTDYVKSLKADERCKAELMSLDSGVPYTWMLEHLFPKLRCAVAVYSGLKAESDSAESSSVDDNLSDDSKTEIESSDNEDVSLAGDDNVVINGNESGGVVRNENVIGDNDKDLLPSAEIVNDSLQTELKPRYQLALKTNLLYYAALLPNLELEWMINNKWSVALDGNVACYGDYDRNKSYRLYIIDTEARRWIKPREPWHGMYLGMFAGVGWYDLENGGTGYYGEGVMTGVSFGYMWPVSKTLSFETGIGVGYMYTRYKEYIPLDGHHLYQRTKGLNYVGPLKLKFSLVWRFLDSNKSKKVKQVL